MRESEVMISREGPVGRLTLDRPEALHALTLGMCEAMIEALLAWRGDPAVALVIIDHAGERGFCAGGDIRMLADSSAGDGAAARQFFFTEYQLNHLLFSYPKPIIAFIDGITMGGGVGIALPARYRVATERTRFAMPETGIGLFPDVGGGWYLPRLPGKVGLWLALTGARLTGRDCVGLGLATHFINSAELADTKARLGSLDSIALASAGTSVDDAPLQAVLASAGTPVDAFPLQAVLPMIDRLFAGNSVAAIIAALEKDGSAWAAEQLAVLRSKSPQALKLAYRQLALGAALPDFAANMAMEYRIAARVVCRHDFREGVRAVIIDKDNAPAWSPASLDEVSDAMLDDIFAPLPADAEWTPLKETA